MTNLTDAQTELLTQAAAAPAGAIEAPEDAKLTKPLIKQGLLISVPKPEGGSRLMITDVGRIAIGREPETAAAPEVVADKSPAPEVPAETAKLTEPKGKLGALLALLKRPEGATIDAMITATGWQAHSVRGAMSGALKKKLGLTIASEKTEAGWTYRIESDKA